MAAAGFIPYCGLAPVPGAVHWNTDPVLAVALLTLCAASAVQAARCDGSGLRRALQLQAMGWAACALALLSPLCHLSVALFSARVAQHMILLLVATPLIAAAPLFPGWARWKAGVAAPTVLLAIVLWAWHMPALYDLSLRDNAAYWAMQISLVGSGWLFWRAMANAAGARPMAAIGAVLATGMQMCALGVILALAGHSWFAVHEATTWAWGLTPIEDQQLGGLVMWVPGGTIFAVLGLVGLARAMAPSTADRVDATLG
jgi:putative membrane protein